MLAPSGGGLILYQAYGNLYAMTGSELRPNGDALRKCILKGPYTPSTVIIPAVLATDNSLAVPEQTIVEKILNMSPKNKAHFESEKEAIYLILTGIGEEIYSTVDACKTAHEMWEAIKRLQQGESLNIQDVKTNLFWEFGKFTSHDGETMESYYKRFYKLMNEMKRNNLTVATMQVSVQFLQKLQPEWSRFVTIVKQKQKLDEVSYHKLFDILKQYQKEVNELCAERIAKNANPLALVATAQPKMTLPPLYAFNMDSSMGKMCLEKDVIEISSDRNEGSGDWDSPEYKDTAGSGEKKEPEALVFHKIYTEEDSDRYIAQCFVNGLYASDGEINLEKNDNLISNDYAVKLCLEYEVRKGKKLVKKELMVLLHPFEEDSEKTEKSSDDWDQLLDFNFDDVPNSGEELPPFVCKMGKSNRNKKRAIENLNLFYQDIGPSSSTGRHLTQEEAAKEELAIRISQRYALLEEERHVIETMAYNEKYKKILNEIWKDKVELDGKTVKEDEKAVKRIKGEALKEKDDPGAFIFPIRLEGKVNKNALVDTGSDINTMPYRIFETLGREDTKKVDRGITMINHTQAEAMGKLSNVICQVGVTTIIAKFLILDIPIDRDALIVVGRDSFIRWVAYLTPQKEFFSTFDGVYHQTFRATRFDVLRTAESDSDDEEEYVIKRNKF
ncbi:agenet domain-containing protein [Tanacetum coccineum]|uniref:Agenet domain-containing protein n=1 Tax=Tanacetum coccineum TaxID=301880 RepID=A0ABQ5BSN9_9ASTR